MFFCKIQNRVHVTRPPCEMDCDNGTSTRAENAPDGIRRDILRVPVDVGNHRLCSAHDCATSRCNECAAGNDYFVAQPNAERLQREFQCNGSIGECDSMFTACKGGELRFKFSAFISSPIINFA